MADLLDPIDPLEAVRLAINKTVIPSKKEKAEGAMATGRRLSCSFMRS